MLMQSPVRYSHSPTRFMLPSPLLSSHSLHFLHSSPVWQSPCSVLAFGSTMLTARRGAFRASKFSCSTAPRRISRPSSRRASTIDEPSLVVSTAAAEAPPKQLPPEVVERRLENEARRRSTMEETLASDAGETAKWWEVDCPVNMRTVTTLAELQAAVEEAHVAGRLAVVNFFAPECYACRSMQPKLRQIARDNAEVLFFKVDGASTEELRVYCEDMGITRIPSFHLYVAGARAAAFTANMRPEKLALLRKEIATHRAAAAAAASGDVANVPAPTMTGA